MRSAYRSALFVLGAQAYTNPALFRQCASACQPVLFVLSAQAHFDPYSFSSARKRLPILSLFPQRQCLPICTLCPQHASAYQSVLFVLRNPLTYVPAKALVNMGLGPECTRPDRYQRQDTVAAANLVIPIASMGHTGSTLPPRSSPLQPLWLPISYLHSCLPPRLSRSLCSLIPF